MRGRKPMPTALKVLTPRGQRKDAKARIAKEPRPNADKPRKPPKLPAAVARKWDQLADQLHTMGVLTTIDADILLAYCRSWVRYNEAEEHIKQFGMVVNGKQNPHVAIADQSLKQVHKLGTELGMTPSARTRIQVDKPQRPDSPLTKMLKQRSG